MSRTYKSFAGHLRSPRGHRRAKLAKVRRGALPPNPWDDVPPCPSTQIPYKVAFALHKKGWEYEKVIKHLKYKYKLKDWEARIIANKHYWWKCKCEECRAVWASRIIMY